MYQSKIQSIRHSTALNRSLNRFHGFEANFSDTLVLGTYGRAVRSNMHSQCRVTFISFQNAFAVRMCVCVRVCRFGLYYSFAEVAYFGATTSLPTYISPLRRRLSAILL